MPIDWTMGSRDASPTPANLLGRFEVLLGKSAQNRARLDTLTPDLRSARERQAIEAVVLGLSALRRADLDAAVSCFDQAIALDPQLERAWLYRAGCLPTKEERLGCLRQALVIKPDSALLQDALESVEVAARGERPRREAAGPDRNGWLVLWVAR